MTYDEAHRLIKKGDLVSLRAELDGGLSVNLSSRFSWTLLTLAALEGNTAIGDLLISRGAALDTMNDFGETALSHAAFGGHVPFVKLLLANGASTECGPHGQSLEDWLKDASDLLPDKIALILELIKRARR
jgi:ankyrin repeat protein